MAIKATSSDYLAAGTQLLQRVGSSAQPTQPNEPPASSPTNPEEKS